MEIFARLMVLRLSLSRVSLVVHIVSQDLSIAGKRAGLAGERSGLFMEMIRVIKEMRGATNGECPKFAIWENVRGALSSNNGEDFRCVLEEFAHIVEADATIPKPSGKGGKWSKSGAISGNGWSLAWRLFDAQYWGVPQRRQRIALVMDLRGQRAAEILFERTGVSGNPEQSISAWKGIARPPEECASGNDRVVENERAYTLKIRSGCEGGGKGATLSTLQDQTLICLADNGFDGYNSCLTGCISSTLGVNCGTSTGRNGVIQLHNLKQNISTAVFESHSQDARYTQQDNTSPACTAQWGTGGNNMPLVAEKKAFAMQRIGEYKESEQASTMKSRDYKDATDLITEKETNNLRWIVRRLTPLEDERLQGFPDGWTDIGDWIDENGKKHKTSDAARYKALGNSIALPQWYWIFQKMKPYIGENPTLGSLFDGIGGFPLVFESTYGDGTAIWGSEIEPFCVAVTKKHFPED